MDNDIKKFNNHYSICALTYTVKDILKDIFAEKVSR
jgi:hypothetical protein